MKIVKRVGERLPHWVSAELRAILTFTGAGSALWAGSCELAGRAWDRFAARLDWRERTAAIVGSGYVAGFSAIHAPKAASFAASALAIAWCAAAYALAPPALDAPAPEPQAAGTRDGFVLWLVSLMTDRPGIHLRDLYPAMRELPGHEDRDNTQLRAALRTLGIPVRRSLRLGGVAGRSGVALADLEPLPSPPGELGGDFDGDAGQAMDSPDGERPGERLESA
jgi:hypothetical protein